MPIVMATLRCLRGTSAMRCCVGFFMGNSLSDPEDLLIPLNTVSLTVDEISETVGLLEPIKSNNPSTGYYICANTFS